MMRTTKLNSAPNQIGYFAIMVNYASGRKILVILLKNCLQGPSAPTLVMAQLFIPERNVATSRLMAALQRALVAQ